MTVGHFEGIDSEQDIEQCWGKSLPLSVHEEVFAPLWLDFFSC